MTRVLVVAHAPTPSVAALRDAVVAGVADDAFEGAVDVVARPALEADAADVEASDAVVLVTPVNFGYISGGLKDFFDRTYRQLREQRPRFPFATVLKGTTDATGALRAVEQITTGLGWRQVVEPLVVLGDVTDVERAAAHDLGATVAATLLLG